MCTFLLHGGEEVVVNIEASKLLGPIGAADVIENSGQISVLSDKIKRIYEKSSRSDLTPSLISCFSEQSI